MYYLGLMSGTSMDAVDTALVEFSESGLQVAAYEQHDIPDAVQQQVREFQSSASVSLTTELDVILGELYAEVINGFLESLDISPSNIAAIGCHGQTVLHLPTDRHPRTLQIGDANIIAHRTTITTVADFRRMDIAAGGEGAPLAPAFHAWYFGTEEQKCILNIGGMSNLSVLGQGTTLGFDCGPGNALLDDWTRLNRGEPFDRDGSWALSGTPSMALLNAMLSYEYFEKAPPKSTGKDEFNLDWLKMMCSRTDEGLAPEDVQATLMRLSSGTIAAAIKRHAGSCNEVIVCGGGYHNQALMQQLREALPNIPVLGSDVYGIDPDAMEAVAFAWLARQRMELQAGNLPAVTGASEPVVLGAVYQARPGGL